VHLLPEGDLRGARLHHPHLPRGGAGNEPHDARSRQVLGEVCARRTPQQWLMPRRLAPRPAPGASPRSPGLPRGRSSPGPPACSSWLLLPPLPRPHAPSCPPHRPPPRVLPRATPACPLPPRRRRALFVDAAPRTAHSHSSAPSPAATTCCSTSTFRCARRRMPLDPRVPPRPGRPTACPPAPTRPIATPHYLGLMVPLGFPLSKVSHGRATSPPLPPEGLPKIVPNLSSSLAQTVGGDRPSRPAAVAEEEEEVTRWLRSTRPSTAARRG
jgi:hypothetical protein